MEFSKCVKKSLSPWSLLFGQPVSLYGRWPSPGSSQLKLNSFQNSGEFSAARCSSVVYGAENSQQREIQSIDLGADPPVRRSCSLCKTNNNLKLGGGGGVLKRKGGGGFRDSVNGFKLTLLRRNGSLLACQAPEKTLL